MATQLAYYVNEELKTSNPAKARFTEKGFINNIFLLLESAGLWRSFIFLMHPLQFPVEA